MWGERLMQYQPPGEDYLDHTTEPCDWLMIYHPPPDEIGTAVFLDYSAAIHEASHAVLCEHFGYKVIEVTIQSAMGRFAQIELTEQNPEHIIIIAHAGYVGQIQVVSKRHASSMANEDIRMMRGIREREKYTNKQAKELRQQCLDLVEQNWIVIQEVADALATKKQLTGDEVRAIIQNTKTI
jgi:hypothetical protein